MDASTDVARPTRARSHLRVFTLAVFYLVALALITAFLVRDSFDVPGFIYQNF